MMNLGTPHSQYIWTVLDHEDCSWYMLYDDDSRRFHPRLWGLGIRIDGKLENAIAKVSRLRNGRWFYWCSILSGTEPTRRYAQQTVTDALYKYANWTK